MRPKLIFVDAFVPKEGKTLMEIVPEKVKHLFLDSSLDSHPGFIPPKEFAIDLDEHKNLLTRRCSPQPLRTLSKK